VLGVWLSQLQRHENRDVFWLRKTILFRLHGSLSKVSFQVVHQGVDRGLQMLGLRCSEEAAKSDEMVKIHFPRNE